MVGTSRRFKTLTYHRKHGNAKSASVQNSWRLLEKAVLIEKAEKKHTYEDPGIYIYIYIDTSGSYAKISLGNFRLTDTDTPD